MPHWRARRRVVAAAELHASLVHDAPPSTRQPVPASMCSGTLKNVDSLGPSMYVLHRHYASRGEPLPNVSAILDPSLPGMAPMCWDHMCWYQLSHGN